MQDQPQAVTVRNGHFRIARGYDPSVRVPDVVLKCVAFVGEVTHEDSAGVSGDLLATGFFVSVPCESPSLAGQMMVYFVTAKHVATDLRDKKIYLLVNRKGGGVTELTSVLSDRWWLHPTDKTADVAVIQVGNQSDADIKSIALENFGLPERLKTLGIGIGDEVFATGLFTPAPGVSQNMPIVRHGNLAMMPSEQIQTKLGYADVYLVEARSIGGLSGSPVFVRPTLNFELAARPMGMKYMHTFGHGGTLLGLMHGHWDIKESDMNKAFFAHDSRRGVNLGVGIVVPAIKIYETLYRPELAAMRKEKGNIIEQSCIPKMDSAKPNDEQVFTQEDFEAALKKASRKTTPKV